MATPPARGLRCTHHALLAIHLFLAALAALCSTFLFSTALAAPNLLASAQDVGACTEEGSLDAHWGSIWTTPQIAKGVRRDIISQPISCPADSLSVLIFQTSITLPCITTTLIRPPRWHEPPVHAIIASPTQSGTYPVILFKHGFSLANCFYTQLFQNLASSGYIVVAPQQAVTLSPDCTQEITKTAKVANWIPKSLAVVLNEAMSDANVVPDVSKLVMAGHSRGGKVAFAMALGMPSAELPSFSALVVLDPVDGTDSGVTVKPPIVEAGCDHTHNKMLLPVLILGTGYGSEKGILGAPPCAPTCCNHAAYFNCSSSPIIYHFVASEYGHLDFLDDSQVWTPAMCVSGRSKAPLRDFSSRLFVAFLRSTLEGNHEDMDYIVESWESASIKLEEPQVYMEEEALLKTEHIVKNVQEAAF